MDWIFRDQDGSTVTITPSGEWRRSTGETGAIPPDLAKGIIRAALGPRKRAGHEHEWKTLNTSEQECRVCGRRRHRVDGEWRYLGPTTRWRMAQKALR